MIQLPPTVTTPEDLLAEFERTGETAPFEEIVRRYSGMVYGVCYRVTRNAHDAEDATQATFLKLATHARLGFVSPRTGQGGGVPRVGPWLQQVAKTTAVDLRRSKSRRHNREQIRAAIEEQQQAVSDATDDASMDELKQVLRDEVDRLPVHYRTPLILYYFGGMSTEQIAVELKTNAKALAVRLFRARKMLGTRLTARGVATAGGMVGSLVVADAILASLAGTVFKTGGAGSLYATGAAGTSFLSSWATSHSAICATITSRINSTMRAAAIGMVASKWKMSLAMLLTVGTTMAGTSEVIQQAPVVRDLGRVIEQIGQALRDLGSVGQRFRSATPNLQAANEQPQQPAPESATPPAIVPVSPMKIEPPAWPSAPSAAAPSLPMASRSPTASRSAFADSAQPSAGWVSSGPSAIIEPPPIARPAALDGSASAMLLAMNDQAANDPAAPRTVGSRSHLGRAGDRSAISLADGESSPRSAAEAFVGPVAMAAMESAGPDFTSLLAGQPSGRVGPYSHAAGGSASKEPSSGDTTGAVATGAVPSGPVDGLIDITGGQTPDNLLIASGRAGSDFTDPGVATPPDLSSLGKGLDFIDPTVLTQPAINPPATQPIPEPAIAGLLALGAIGLLARRRRSSGNAVS